MFLTPVSTNPKSRPCKQCVQTTPCFILPQQLSTQRIRKLRNKEHLKLQLEQKSQVSTTLKSIYHSTKAKASSCRENLMHYVSQLPDILQSTFFKSLCRQSSVSTYSSATGRGFSKTSNSQHHSTEPTAEDVFLLAKHTLCCVKGKMEITR